LKKTEQSTTRRIEVYELHLNMPLCFVKMFHHVNGDNGDECWVEFVIFVLM